MSYRTIIQAFLLSFGLIATQGVFAMKLTSPAFNEGNTLPIKYTCQGKGVSPPLNWQEIPDNTKSLALIYDDPDAPRGTWTHWVLFNLPPTTTSLSEDVQTLPPGTYAGVNSWGQLSYGAPCPPSGQHRYIFHLYALDMQLNLTGKITSERLQQVMQGHIITTATLLGKYQKNGGKIEQ